MKKVLVYLDPDAVSDSIDLLAVADQMYGPQKYVSWGFCVEGASEQGRGVFDSLASVDDSRISRYDIENIAVCMEDLNKQQQFDAVLVPATTFGRMLAPRVAMRLHLGLVADVTAIRRNGTDLEIVRPAFSGRMLAGIVCRGEGPVMMSVRGNTFSREVQKIDVDTVLVPLTPSRVRTPGVRLLERRPKPRSGDIRESEVLISGGGGVQRNFRILDSLAAELHGMVSASRRVVDSGVAPRHIQVGQSGKTVSPRLYVAIGISGSIQHVVGLRSAEYVIAVNSDRHAPICSLADLVVEGDGSEFVERIVQRIQKGRSNEPNPGDSDP